MKNVTLGKVYLVGAGPGAADLITVRGAKLLEQADIVFHDALVDPAMLELCPQAIKVPVGKRCGKLSSAQHFINKRLIDAAQKHQIIVRLKGGDPMMFGRADEEIQALKQHHIEVQVVPGITAALAGAAAIQQSLTLRGVSRSVAFVTLAQADEAEENKSQPLQNPSADTVVYYMGRKDASNIAKQLIGSNSQHTNQTPVHILEAVSTKNERHWSSTLGELANGKANNWFDSASPALIMVGQALREHQQATTQTDALESSSAKIDDGLQDSAILPDSRRCA
ncbi:uroporphyrinogen-III C-methyltransferase [Polynucleobacter sp. AP-Sving-400A-A2]|uniref:uroporphyrinogen-III C-methyltransferase n=1 Tax=Polynucleobacter sp. AP-Sving-400A-A2 TaxID=2081049 RepID=UPI001BFCE3D4|nr:uroporphyrinogen-III C-methyltransferase [Polynucleobacter sp. AP-Sving-400A-A2]QWE14876.1 uroporphyrinogen-III C-methyltransferase [Polynucleobacter sp. AP-Sving-400A-A2]